MKKKKKKTLQVHVAIRTTKLSNCSDLASCIQKLRNKNRKT